MPFLTIVEIISLTIKRRVNPEQARSLLRTGPKYAITGLKGARRATLFLLVRNFTQPLFLLLFHDKTPSSLASFLRFSVKTVNEITHLYMTLTNNKQICVTSCRKKRANKSRMLSMRSWDIVYGSFQFIKNWKELNSYKWLNIGFYLN